MNGQRKYKACVWSLGVLLVGFAWSVQAKADPSLFTGFVGGIGVILGTFVWGNVKTHQIRP